MVSLWFTTQRNTTQHRLWETKVVMLPDIVSLHDNFNNDDDYDNINLTTNMTFSLPTIRISLATTIFTTTIVYHWCTFTPIQACILLRSVFEVCFCYFMFHCIARHHTAPTGTTEFRASNSVFHIHRVLSSNLMVYVMFECGQQQCPMAASVVHS